jgi:hypothetical protein
VQLGPTLTAIESAGSTDLNKDTDGNLYANSTPIFKSAGIPLTLTTYADFTPVAAEDFGSEGGKQLVFRFETTGNVVTWTLDDNWTRSGALPWIVEENLVAFNQHEIKFGVDLDEDGDIGEIGLTAIETDGNTSLEYNATTGQIYAGGQPISKDSTTPLTMTTYVDFVPLAVEDFGEQGGRQLVFRHAPSGDLVTWTLDSNWRRSGSSWKYQSRFTEFNAYEAKFDYDFNQDTRTGLTVLEETGTTPLSYDSVTGEIFVNGSPIYRGFNDPLTFTTYADYTPIALEDFGDDGGKQLVFRHTPDGDLLTWELNDDWTRAGFFWTRLSALSSFNTYEAKFTTDFDDDGTVGLSVIESAGTVRLLSNSEGLLFANDQPLMKSASEQLSLSTYADYTPIAVEDLGENGGKQLVFRYETTGNLLKWELTATWSRSGSFEWIKQSLPTTFNETEFAFGVDGDSDGDIGITEIDTAGNLMLKHDSGGVLYAGDQIIYKSAGVPLTLSTYVDYTPLAVEDFGAEGGKQLVFRFEPTGHLATWQLDTNYKRSANLGWTLNTNFVTFNAYESKFAVDFNQDNNIALTAIEAAGNTYLARDAAGLLYANNLPLMKSSSEQLSLSTYTDFTPVAIEDFGGSDGRQLVLRYEPTGNLAIWKLSSSWTRNGSLGWVTTANPANFNAFEIKFGADFNGNLSIG